MRVVLSLPRTGWKTIEAAAVWSITNKLLPVFITLKKFIFLTFSVEKLSRQCERSKSGRQSCDVGERQTWNFEKFGVDKTTGRHSSDRCFERGMNSQLVTINLRNILFCEAIIFSTDLLMVIKYTIVYNFVLANFKLVWILINNQFEFWFRSYLIWGSIINFELSMVRIQVIQVDQARLIVV